MSTQKAGDIHVCYGATFMLHAHAQRRLTTLYFALHLITHTSLPTNEYALLIAHLITYTHTHTHVLHVYTCIMAASHVCCYVMQHVTREHVRGMVVGVMLLPLCEAIRVPL